MPRIPVYVGGKVKIERPTPRCPNCGTTLDGVTGTAIGGEMPEPAEFIPGPGDISMCCYCGELLQFQPDMTSARLPAIEFLSLSPDERNFLRNLSEQVKLNPLKRHGG